MGYNTKFEGKLSFTNQGSFAQLQKLMTFLGADCRDHPEWGRPDLSYIDLRISKDGLGIEWDGSEKTYDLVDKVNLVISEMQKEFPDFGLSGSMRAQGEEVSDTWMLTIIDGKATSQNISIHGAPTECPPLRP